MREKELLKLKTGDFIQHKHLGLCIVGKQQFAINGQWFGLIIKPVTITGLLKLAHWSGVLFNTMLEDSKRLIISKEENPIIPKLIFEKKSSFEVHKWKNIGEVSSDGKFSSIKLKSFSSIDEALCFANN